nr:MAG TPA: hypothetical protein [Caudoviricetes sp.]
MAVRIAAAIRTFGVFWFHGFPYSSFRVPLIVILKRNSVL